jgi:hypothetical protein
MAPEQLSGGVRDVRTDLFGVGATAWALLTGHGPYETTSLETTREAALAGVPHPLPRWVPRELASLLYALVAAEPGRRPAFAADVGAALAALPWPDGALPTLVVPRPPPSAATMDLARRRWRHRARSHRTAAPERGGAPCADAR